MPNPGLYSEIWFLFLDSQSDLLKISMSWYVERSSFKKSVIIPIIKIKQRKNRIDISKEDLYSSLRYTLEQEIKIPDNVGLVCVKIEVFLFSSNQEEGSILKKGLDGKTKAYLERSNDGIYRSGMSDIKFKLNCTSFNYNSSFYFKLFYFKEDQLTQPFMVLTSDDFKVYARQSVTLKKKRKRKDEFVKPLKKRKVKCYDEFISEIDKLVKIMNLMDPETKKKANLHAMEKIVDFEKIKWDKVEKVHFFDTKGDDNQGSTGSTVKKGDVQIKPEKEIVQDTNSKEKEIVQDTNTKFIKEFTACDDENVAIFYTPLEHFDLLSDLDFSEVELMDIVL